MNENPPTWVWLVVAGALAVALGGVAIVKRDELKQFVKGFLKVPGHKEPLRVVSVPGIKGMVV